MNTFLAAGLLPALALIAGPTHAATLSFLVSDQDTDQVLVATDLNGDGDTDDDGEVRTFFSAANASGLTSPSGNVFALGQSADGSVLLGDGDTDSVYRVRDNNTNGTADDAGEAVLWFSGSANAAGYKLNTPNGIATGPDGAVYVVEADTNGSPTGDWVYRTQDLNGDGDANDAGEATRWLSLTGLNAKSSPFEIRFSGNDAYVIDTAGTDNDRIYRASDANNDGVIGAGEVGIFAEETKAYGALFDFAMDVGGGSVWTWQWLAEAGKWSVFKLTDLDGSGLIDAAAEVAEAWSTALLPAGYTGLAGFGMDYDDVTGNILLAMNGPAANGKWIAQLTDLDGDGLFLSAGESGIVLSKSDQGTYPSRPRNVSYYSTPDQPSPVPLPATLPLAGAGLAGLAALRRRRVR